MPVAQTGSLGLSPWASGSRELMNMGLAQTPFCGVCDAPQWHVMDRPARQPRRPTGPFGKSQTPQNGVCASPENLRESGGR